MKHLITGILGFCLLLAAPLAAQEQSGAPQQGGNLKVLKQPIKMSYGINPRLAVTFNHSTHKDIKCRLCHHEVTESGKRFVKCTNEECHSIKGARERDPLSMFMAYHARDTDRSCYGCHKAEAASHPEFKGCRPCHMSPQAKKVMAEMEKK